LGLGFHRFDFIQIISISILLLLVLVLHLLFFIINFRTQKFNIEQIEINSESIHIEYWIYNRKAEPVVIPIGKLSFEYFGHTKGPNGGDHIRIEANKDFTLNQYTNDSWPLKKLKLLNQELQKIKTTANTK